MWIFMSDSFLSIVANEKKPELLVVRARAAGDLERAFPGRKVKVTKTPHRDYMYRTELPRQVVANSISSSVMGITATNFKNSVKDDARHTAYLNVWTSMMRYQERLHEKPKAFEPELDFGSGFSANVCSRCGGSGSIRRGAYYSGTCPACDGSGYAAI